ncbi:MAG: helix-turn-helix domain-containing protein [Parabacteroides sp.]|nr:helix-turn-helix domain-containing protein [Parabacteroides sp.]
MKTQHQIQVMAAFAELGQRLQRIEKNQSLLNPARPEWLDTPDVCNQLHISKRTLGSYREKGYLGFTKIGGKVFYSQTDIDNYLNDHKVRKEGRS